MFLFLLSIDANNELKAVADNVLSDIETEARLALLLAGFHPHQFRINRMETPDDA